MGESEDDDLNVLPEVVPDFKESKEAMEIPNGVTMEDQASSGVEGGVDIDTLSSTLQSQTADAPQINATISKHESLDVNVVSSSGNNEGKDKNDVLYAGDDDVNSEHALSNDDRAQNNNRHTSPNNDHSCFLGDFPMHLPTFKPAIGCTNASDFIVHCFAARLRSGITVVKHGRSRWCRSRLRVLHIHPDGRSLSWKPAVGESHSPKTPPKLDLTTCEEVRHAWSPDPQNPMYTGTPILRQKCEAADAHKSFALIFLDRTVDITSVTADQCKVLMEGFSALCFRLQVAHSKKGTQKMPEEEDPFSIITTAGMGNTDGGTSIEISE